jgi:adenosylmethionine-8-amino-7-oxononanoate aminotransferase
VPDWPVWQDAPAGAATYAALRSADLAHVWHPYTPTARLAAQDFPIIARAGGVWLEDVRGHRMLDGISSWWCANLGHGHPQIVAAIQTQAARLQHSILGGMSHPAAIRLASELTALAPAGLTRAYFCSDGASATEAAMRMAIEYWHHRGCPAKHRLVSLAGGYHGDTLGAVGVGYLESFHAPLRQVVRPGLQAESPHCFACAHRTACSLQCFDAMERLLTARGHEVAAVIIEPLCQAAAGMRIYPAGYLQRLRALCDRCGVLWIADEIAVGFGRTGTCFACEHAGVAPDLMCVGKGLTGGALPMSAVLCRSEIYDAFGRTDGADHTFYHGHTFGGNPIAAAAALAALGVYRDEALWTHTRLLARQLADGFARLAALPAVANVRTLGLMSALQVRGGAAQARAIADRALRGGLLIRPLGDILYLWPPLVTTPDELDDMLARLTHACS